MAEETTTLEDLKEAMEGTAPDVSAPGAGALMSEAPILYEQKIDEHNRAYATGKRKNAIARVWLKPGPGKITVNGRDVEKYFARPVLRMIINQPFVFSEREGQYDVDCTVKGGGLSGQAFEFSHLERPDAPTDPGGERPRAGGLGPAGRVRTCPKSARHFGIGSNGK